MQKRIVLRGKDDTRFLHFSRSKRKQSPPTPRVVVIHWEHVAFCASKISSLLSFPFESSAYSPSIRIIPFGHAPEASWRDSAASGSVGRPVATACQLRPCSWRHEKRFCLCTLVIVMPSETNARSFEAGLGANRGAALGLDKPSVLDEVMTDELRADSALEGFVGAGLSTVDRLQSDKTIASRTSNTGRARAIGNQGTCNRDNRSNTILAISSATKSSQPPTWPDDHPWLDSQDAS